MPTEIPWFERWPELAAWELERFRARGLPAEVMDEARAQGRFVVKSRVAFAKGMVDITVEYPAETPELPPVVFAEPGLLERHQHAFGGNFCLLERPLDDWPAGSWGAADLIAERLTALLADSEAGPEVVRAHEAPMPEPFSTYYAHAMGPVVLMPGDLGSPAGDRGTLRLRLFDPASFRFVVEAVGGVASEQDALDVVGGDERLEVPWLRVPAPPPGPDGPAVASWLRASHQGLLRPPVPPKLVGSRRVAVPRLQVVGVVFQEEGPGVGEQRDAWVFLCVPRDPEPGPFLAHCQVVSAQERFRRTPDLAGLTEKKAVVVGLGTLGGEIAVALAKSGFGSVDVVDHDRFEANNAVRHVLGIEWAGVPKTYAVATACRRANPFCAAVGHDLLLGQSSWEGSSSVERLRAMLEDADVIVDATGSHQLQRFIARMAQEGGVPFVSSWLTEGFWGVEIVRIVPGATCCFLHFASDHADGKLPRAGAGPDAPVVAQGCAHPTVSGAAVDSSEAAILTARLSVQTVLEGQGYPESSWDYAAVTLRGGDATHPTPTTSEQLLPREDCATCSPDAGSTEAV